MSAFGAKADMTIRACLLSRSLLGVKRTWTGAMQMSAFDPKRTFMPIKPQVFPTLGPNRYLYRSWGAEWDNARNDRKLRVRTRPHGLAVHYPMPGQRTLRGLPENETRR